MNNKQKIEKALALKGYTPEFIEFERISYYSSGREGGWHIGVKVADNDYCFPNWFNVDLPIGLKADIFEESFMCFNITDALTIINLLPHFNKDRWNGED